MKTTRRQFVQALGLAGVSAALAGCDGGNDALSKLIYPEEGGDFRPPTSAEIDLVAHVINRLGFGAAPGEYRRVAALGVDAFLDEQLHPERIDDKRCDRKLAQIESLFEPTPELFDYTAK